MAQLPLAEHGLDAHSSTSAHEAPSPEKPSLHEHEKPPSVLVQEALASHGDEAHSSLSEHEKPSPE